MERVRQVESGAQLMGDQGSPEAFHQPSSPLHQPSPSPASLPSYLIEGGLAMDASHGTPLASLPTMLSCPRCFRAQTSEPSLAVLDVWMDLKDGVDSLLVSGAHCPWKLSLAACREQADSSWLARTSRPVHESRLDSIAA